MSVCVCACVCVCVCVFTSDVALRIHGAPLEEKCTVNGNFSLDDPVFLDTGISTLVRRQDKICPFNLPAYGE